MFEKVQTAELTAAHSPPEVFLLLVPDPIPFGTLRLLAVLLRLPDAARGDVVADVQRRKVKGV